MPDMDKQTLKDAVRQIFNCFRKIINICEQILKGAVCSFREDLHWLIFLCLNNLNKPTLFVFITLKETQFHILYVADPAFLASNSVLGTSFSYENSLFIQLGVK